MKKPPHYHDKISRITSRDIALIRDLRYAMGESQTQFWQRFGVSQSCGSRIERCGAIPFPVLILTRLHLLNIIDDKDLARVSSANFENADQRPAAKPRASQLPTLNHRVQKQRA